MYKNYYRIIVSTILLVVSPFLILFLNSCSCDERIYLAVLGFPTDDKGCITAADQVGIDKLPGLTLACPGDTVTICWGGNVKNNKINVIGEVLGQAGSRQHIVTGSETITIDPQGDCAPNKNFKIEVVDKETPAPYDGCWVGASGTNKCGYISFKISENFMSRSIKALRITPKFDLTDATHSPCNIPPFLTGTNLEDPGTFTLNKPNEEVPFSTPKQAVGEWRFDFFDDACKRECKSNAVLPFVLILKCPEP